MKKKKNMTRSIAVRFTPENYKKLEKEAENEKIPVSTMVRVKIQTWLDRQEARTA